MAENPKLSIIIPTWNSEDTIAACLFSVFAQTMTDYEVIVVDDGSTDHTIKKCIPFTDRITLMAEEHRGSNPTRNRGRTAARGEFLLFLDSDLVLRPDTFQKLLGALAEHPDASYAYSSFRHGFKLFRLWPFDADRLRRMPCIPTFSLIRAVDFPGFDETLTRLQDWDLWLTMLERGKTGVWVPETLMVMQRRKQGISQWVPRWIYWIPWKKLPWRPLRVQKYLDAVSVIKKKHNLSSPSRSPIA